MHAEKCMADIMARHLGYLYFRITVGIRYLYLICPRCIAGIGIYFCPNPVFQLVQEVICARFYNY
jgi:hypothetical protein